MGNTYQTFLIVLGVAATLLFSVFFYREVAPEYLIYQKDYIALEKFRASYTHEPAPEFKTGVKQIVIEREDKGPPLIDRCISCHVALQIEDFSKTKIAKDVSGNIRYDAQGYPLKVENPDYVWKRLDDRIKALRDPKVNEQLAAQGAAGKVNANLQEAERLEKLKYAKVGEFEYDVEKVLAMHPLIGRETRPFEFHPIDDYGCTSCHGGNGRGLVTDRAHGPVFDGQYEIEYQGHKPNFLEKDPDNDPPFSKVFNDKPGARLIFQTDPIYTGALIQAKCIACHQDTQGVLEKAAGSAESVLERNEKEAEAIQKGFNLEKQEVIDLIALKKHLMASGYENTLKALKERQADYTLSQPERDKISSQLKFLMQGNQESILERINQTLMESFGSAALSQTFQDSKLSLDQFLEQTESEKEATGTLYQKQTQLALAKAILKHVQDVGSSFEEAVKDKESINAIQTDVDRLTSEYHQGKELYVAQACYACHRIAGFSRGGVGPELTYEGASAYPWYVKQKISWPQSDLPNSTMPNLRLDHDELEALVTFVLGQKGAGQKFTSTTYKSFIQDWESGKIKQPFEKPVTPRQIHDLRFGMTVFATEGCAACHRLKGFESNVGFQVEKNSPSFEAIHHERQWFQKLFPENLLGSQLVKILEEKEEEIDQRIVANVRKDSIIEEIEKSHPGLIEGFYTNFKFAARAQNKKIADKIENESDPERKKALKAELKAWKERVNRVLMVYIQEYGLGRLICPRPNWAGVYRSDQWLMEHFRNPSSHVPRSIMPVFPFDDTRFYALTYMLDVIGQKNLKEDRAVWEHYGFNPAEAFHQYCAQCHGDYLLGNGPVSEWIYPIPKNLRNGEFLRNLTKENAYLSIMHGVKGTPMPPWGELGKDKPIENLHPVFTETEIHQLVNWLFSSLPGGTVIREEEIPKWRYEPKDIIRELEQEGGELKGTHSFIDLFPNGKGYFASLNPAPNSTENEIFDVVKNPLPGGEENLYYIKKQYYTPENIQAGKDFFEVNCATCHGREADGAGVRAEVMRDAKPRMLINLDWINTRDDLRLLRSIKYGVSGTSMTPWGDQTSALQRLQLVIFIRSLTQNQEERSSLNTALYKAFDTAEFTVEQARIHEFTEFDKAEGEYEELKRKREELDRGILRNSSSPDEALRLYQKELSLAEIVSKKEKIDALFRNLRIKLKEEREIYRAIGDGLMNAEIDGPIFSDFLKLIESNEGRFAIQNNLLKFNEAKEDQSSTKQEIEKRLAELLKGEELKRSLAEGKIASPERVDELKVLDAKIKGIKKLQAQLISGLYAAQNLVKQQREIYISINEQMKTAEKKDEPRQDS